MARRALLSILMITACSLLASGLAQAQTKIRVGKPQAEIFPFLALDLGIETGIFKKHGIEAENIIFSGGAKLEQGLAADAVDIGLGSGPELAFIVKGAPTLAIAALANEPDNIAMTVLKDGPIKTVADLKGKTLSVSTSGSLTDWLTQQLSVQQGWGTNGIKIAALGAIPAQVAAFKTHQIDGVVTDLGTVYRMEEEGLGRTLYQFGKLEPDFHVYVMFGRRAFLDKNPEAVRQFMMGWFESVAYMQQNKPRTVALASEIIGVSPAIAVRLYDELMPVINKDGKFNPKALKVLSRSFLDMGMLDKEPDMSNLVTERYLPIAH